MAALLVAAAALLALCWRSGVAANPWSIAGIASLSTNERVRALLADPGTAPAAGARIGNRQLAEALEGRGTRTKRTFKLGYFTDRHSGTTEYGIVVADDDDEASLLEGPTSSGAAGASSVTTVTSRNREHYDDNDDEISATKEAAQRRRHPPVPGALAGEPGRFFDAGAGTAGRRLVLQRDAAGHAVRGLHGQPELRRAVPLHRRGHPDYVLLVVLFHQ